VKTSVIAFSILGLALASSLTAAAPQPAQPPQPNWYNVEVIVFRNLDPAATMGETWPADPSMPDWTGALALNPPNSIGPAVPYQALSPVNEQLDEDWTRLKRSHDYQPLVHVSWTQPALDRATAPTVRIGMPASAVPVLSTAPVAAIAVPDPTPAPTATTNAMPPQQPTQAYGDAKLSTTGPYLHFDLDLVLQGPVSKNDWAAVTGNVPVPAAGTAPTTVPVIPAFQLYRLRQDRRVDAGKVSYFDNPLFGAIVLVTPVRKP
jgi:hypothetical protein